MYFYIHTGCTSELSSGFRSRRVLWIVLPHCGGVFRILDKETTPYDIMLNRLDEVKPGDRLGPKTAEALAEFVSPQKAAIATVEPE